MATKQIVSKNEIANDPKLQIVKAFRLLNKVIGLLKTQFAEADGNPDTQDEISTDIKGKCSKIRVLSKKAEEAGFHIWVNDDGKTGHTYEKDYKVTSPTVNDYEAYQALVTERQSAIDSLIANLPGENQISLN
jgi:hypothetical protein